MIAVAGGFTWQRMRTFALPRISTTQLDAASASLVEEQLNQLRAVPRSGAAWGKLGSLLKTLEYREEALRCLAIAGRLDSAEPRWPYFRGVLLATESPGDAIVPLRRAVSLCGNEPEAPRLRLAKILAEAGKWEESQHELEELLRARPEHAPALLALAHLAQARGNSTEAVSLANRCTRDPRTARSAWNLLATLHQRRSDTAAALTASQTAASLPPDAIVPDPFEIETITVRGDPRDLSDRAQRLLQSGRLADAGPVIDQLVREHPLFAEGWLLRGRLQLLRRQPAAAEPSIRRHLELNPQSAQGMFQLGMVLLAQDRAPDAATAFEQATRLKPDFGPAFFNLGLALVRSGRRAEAVPPLRAAIRHNPERIDSYLALADLLLQLGQPAEAAALAQQAESIDPSDRRLHTLREKIGGK